MTNPLPVSARRLHRRAAQATDRLLTEASLIPFFDRSGDVRWIILLTPESPDIFLVQHLPLRFRVPLWGPVELATVAKELQPLDRQRAAPLQRLWHWDPWWLLNDPRYAGHAAARILTSTNCAGRLTRKVKMFYFRRDLTRLTGVLIRKKAGTELILWRAALLPPPEPAPAEPPPPAPAGLTWHLDPIWARWARPTFIHAGKSYRTVDTLEQQGSNDRNQA